MPFYLHDQAALDGLIHLETEPSCPPELLNALPVPKPSLVTFCSGVYQSAVFSSKQSIQTLCYRVEYGCVERIKKAV